MPDLVTICHTGSCDGLTINFARIGDDGLGQSVPEQHDVEGVAETVTVSSLQFGDGGEATGK